VIESHSRRVSVSDQLKAPAVLHSRQELPYEMNKRLDDAVKRKISFTWRKYNATKCGS
jgi:tetrahydromethanopterin S-methyltransferase subunit G